MHAFVDALDRNGRVLRSYPVVTEVPEPDAIAQAKRLAAADHLVPEALLPSVRYRYRIDPETDEPA